MSLRCYGSLHKRWIFHNPHKACDLVKFPGFHLIRARLDRSQAQDSFSQDFKELLKFHHQSPVTFLKVISEPVLASIYGLSRNLEGKGSYDRNNIFNMIFQRTDWNPPCWSPCPFHQNVDQTFWERRLQDSQSLCTPESNFAHSCVYTKFSTSSPFLAEGTSCSFFWNISH